MKLIYQTFPLIRLFFYLFVVYFSGWILGLVLSVMIHKTYNYVIFTLYKMEPLSDGDLMFMWMNHDEGHNLVGILRFDTFDPEKMRTLLIERGVKQFRKLRSNLVFEFFDFWWKEGPVDAAIKRIEIVENFSRTISTKKDLVDYTNEELRVRIDTTKELPFNFKIIQNKESNPKYQNLLMLKFDHCLSDGLGIISLITGIADNYDAKLFPRSMRKTPTLLQKFLIYLQFPYYMVLPVVRNMLSLKSGRTPFKSSVPITGTGKTALSSYLDFSTYSKVCKNLKITFNDLMMCVFSSGIRKYCENHFDIVPPLITTMVPIGNRKIPEFLEDIQITNDSTGVGANLTLIHDPIAECKLIHNEFASYVRNVPMVVISKFLNDLVHRYMPFYLSRYIIKTSLRNMDLTFSNVAGPLEHLYYAGSKLIEMIPFFTTGHCYTFIGVISYHGKFRLNITVDRVLEMDPTVLMDFVEKELTYMLKVIEAGENSEISKVESKKQQ